MPKYMFEVGQEITVCRLCPCGNDGCFKYTFEVRHEITTCKACPCYNDECFGDSYCMLTGKTTLVEAQGMIAGKRIDCPLVEVGIDGE